MGRYQAGAISGTSFALACFACLGGRPWSHLHSTGGAYVAGAVLGGLVAFIATTVTHGRRDGSSGTTRALASMAFGWAAGITAVILAVASYALVVVVLSGYLQRAPN